MCNFVILASSLEVVHEEFVVCRHVLLLGEEQVVGDVLHDLTHQSEAALDAGGRLLLHDARLVRRDYTIKFTNVK